MCDKSIFILILLMVCLLTLRPSSCEERINSLPKNEDPQYTSFISARMKHLTAVNELKQVKNSVKQHQLVLDLFKKTFRVLDESRKLVAAIESRDDLSTKASQYIVNYLESIAFFCDLLIFFPEITGRHLEANLLWRVTLIDSIQDAISFNVDFIDEATQAQFEKVYTILSEGVLLETDGNKPVAGKKQAEPKKIKRRPRLISNEL